MSGVVSMRLKRFSGKGNGGAPALVMALTVGLAVVVWCYLAVGAPRPQSPALAQGPAGTGKMVDATSVELELRSPSVVLMDAATRQVLASKNPHERRSPASLTKMMTLVLCFEALEQGRVSMDDVVSASEEACELGGTQIYLEPGERMKFRELLLSVAVASANDASVAVAEHVAGSEAKFVDMMNEKARELGMRDSQFRNSHGLDEEGHYTSAYDMALLCSYASKFPELVKMTSIYQDYIRGGKFWLVNRNKLLLSYEGCDGFKTGHTDKAGYCLAATAKRGDMRLVSVVMGSETPDLRMKETTKLLNYGFANFQSTVFARKGETISHVKVYKGTKANVPVIAADDLVVTVPKGGDLLAEKKVDVPAEVQAPVRKGEALGQMLVRRAGREVGRVALVAGEDVPRLGLLGIFWRILETFWRLK